MPLFSIIKHFHVWFALLTFASLTMRFLWLQSGSRMLRHPAVRVLPHINDTGLLLTGVILAVYLGYTPFTAPWFALKLALIVVYIALGFVLFKAKLSRLYRFIIYFCCFITYSAIILTVLTKPH
ncbi:putative membrane protein SirB2 [Alteromonadaceae bacterium 2753L.S.0a.02]|nr:putative membrane protein SirB2 [Alteromonadaceae bacterium 2753L.S.0a.02]